MRFRQRPMLLVSNLCMRVRWKAVLPLLGLIYFAVLTSHDVRWNQLHQDARRYFCWSVIRLDSDPLASAPCKSASEDCVNWEYPSIDFVTPGLLRNSLVLSALPAFAFSVAIVRGLARLGVSEVVSFMSATPILIVTWCYFVGWLLDRWRNKRSQSQ